MKLVCKDRRQTQRDQGRSARGISSVSSELDRVLGPKNHEELEALEKQVKEKLRSDEDIDVDYWETLLKRLAIHKAKAKLRKVSESVTNARLDALRKQQQQEAMLLQERLRENMSSGASVELQGADEVASKAAVSTAFDPEPFLKLSAEDKTMNIIDEVDFVRQTVSPQQSSTCRIPYLTMQ